MAEGIVVKRIDALREFRARLIKFNQGLADDFAAMERHWRDLHDIWHDDQYDQFGEALSEATTGISRSGSTARRWSATGRRSGTQSHKPGGRSRRPARRWKPKSGAGKPARLSKKPGSADAARLRPLRGRQAATHRIAHRSPAALRKQSNGSTISAAGSAKSKMKLARSARLLTGTSTSSITRCPAPKAACSQSLAIQARRP